MAVDWSGRRLGAGRHIWLAEAGAGGLTRLESGRDRERLGDELIDAADHDPDLVVGLDFAFSFPLWFLDGLGVDSALDVAAELTESWLVACPPPFWGRAGRRRGEEIQFRETELHLRRTLGVRPTSIFQIGGAGAVGTGSLRGLPLLVRLRAAGFAIWPFDAPRPPTVVEIYPRLFTGPLVKGRREAREEYGRRHGLPPEVALTEDSLDAAVSALALGGPGRRWEPDESIPRSIARREGWIAAGAPLSSFPARTG
jgi:hypothetical protein